MSAGDGIIEKCVSKFGLWWPDAEEGDCLLAAGHWWRLREDILLAGANGAGAAAAVVAENRGDSVDCFERFWGSYEQVNLPGVADACKSMALALTDYAGQVRVAKEQCYTLAKKMLAAAAVGIGLAIATGWLLTPAVTAGIAILAAQSAFIAAHLAAAIVITTVAVTAAMGAVEAVIAGLIIAQVNRHFFDGDGSYSRGDALRDAEFGFVLSGLGGGIGAGVRVLRGGGRSALTATASTLDEAAAIVRAPLTSVEDVFKQPRLLAGRTPDEVKAILSGRVEWRAVSEADGGVRWLEYSTTRAPGTVPTGRELRFIPAGAGHGPEPTWYWHESTQKIVWEGHMNPYTGYVRVTPDPPV